MKDFKYSHYLLGEKLTTECIRNISQRISDNDPVWVIEPIVQFEVSKIIKNISFTLNQLEKMLISEEYEFGNGWIIDSLITRLNKVPYTDRSPLRKKYKIFLDILESSIFSWVFTEMRTYFIFQKDGSYRPLE